jgi:hypothetical protein
MAQYAENTKVPAAQSRAEIEHTLERFGATSFAYANQPGVSTIMFEVHGLRVVFRLPLPDREDRKFTITSTSMRRSPTASQALYDQAVRQRWRALAVAIKAKLAAVEAGITTVEDEFLAHVALPTGGTVAEYAVPALRKAYADGSMPALLPGAGG